MDIRKIKPLTEAIADAIKDSLESQGIFCTEGYHPSVAGVWLQHYSPTIKDIFIIDGATTLREIEVMASLRKGE